MSTIALSPRLMEELQQVATEQAAKPEDLVEIAVQTYLRQLERDKIKREAEAFRAMHPELTKQYIGHRVATHHGQVIDHNQDFQALHDRIRQRFGHQAVLLRRVTSDPERVLMMRSPRLEKV